MRSTPTRVGLGALVCFAIGYALGLPDPPAVGAPTDAGESRTNARAPRLPARDASRGGTDASPAPARSSLSAEIAARIREGELELEPELDWALRLVDWGADPGGVVASVLDAASDSQIASGLARYTDFSAEDLESIDDKRAFAKRLAEVAMGGLFGERTALDQVGIGEVSFVDDFTEDRRPGEARLEFGGDADLIYAVFPTEDHAGGDVIVKWFRTDEPEILLLDNYPVSSENGESYVFLRRPEGFDEGRYQVEVYSSNASMDALAAGEYTVVSRGADVDLDDASRRVPEWPFPDSARAQRGANARGDG